MYEEIFNNGNDRSSRSNNQSDIGSLKNILTTCRKSNSTPSLWDVDDNVRKDSVASTEQAASAESLAAKVTFFYDLFIL